MKFRQFVPALNARIRQNAANSIGTPYGADNAEAMFTLAEEMHASNRRPFYRVYPGVVAAMLRLGLEKIDISNVHPPVNGLALEFAEGHFLRVGHLEIAGLMIAELGKKILFIEFVHSDGNRGQCKFSRVHQSILNGLQDNPEIERNLLTQIMQIALGVCMIPHSDTDLLKPLVLNRDKEKFAATGDVKFVDRAKRNGVHGWELGRDIPTPEEMETLRQQHGEPGRKSPHWRMGHFAIRHTGEGRSVPVIRWINETFVNKDLWNKVPHGYHDDDESGASEESRQDQ